MGWCDGERCDRKQRRGAQASGSCEDVTDDLALTFGYQVDDIVTGIKCPGSLDDVDFFVSVAGSVREGASNELDDCGPVIQDRRANINWRHGRERDPSEARTTAKFALVAVRRLIQAF